MAIYEYCCQGCGERSEILLQMKVRGAPQRCSLCGAPLNRVISCPAISIIKVKNSDTLGQVINMECNHPKTQAALIKGMGQRTGGRQGQFRPVSGVRA